MDWFDCNCWYGVPKSPPLAPADTVEVLGSELQRAGIVRALVRNAAIWEESPEVGNRLTSDDCAGDERLVPAWGILPPHTGELGDVSEFLAAMRAAGVPLFLARRELPGAMEVYELADRLLADFPRLHLVVTAHGSWGEDRLFRPLMARYPHFAVDTSRYELDGGIEAICRAYGPERLLFGTNFPETPMGGPMLTLLHAEISDEDRALIAGRNLRRMLEEVRL